MFRNLKPLLAAALALAALGALAASAHASEEFHCSVEPCRWRAITDGTGKQAHQVFVIENSTQSESLSITCEYFRGEATSTTRTTNSLIVEWPNTALRPNHSKEAFNGCKANGTTTVEVQMNTCHLVLKSTGGTTSTATGALSCPAGVKAEIKESTCTFTLAAQELPGLGYSTIGTSPNREITATANVSNIAITADGTKTSCLINPEQTLKATYTTGNTIVIAQKDNLTEKEEVSEGKTPEMADGWFA